MPDETSAPLRFPGGGPTETLLPNGTYVRTDKKGVVTEPETVTQGLRKTLLDAGYVEDTATAKGGA